jgi:hypothetical protein
MLQCLHLGLEFMYVIDLCLVVAFELIFSLQLAFISMVTGWPTDTYDEYNPSTIVGRAACVVACLAGLMLLSWLIEAVSNQMALTPHQRPAVTWVSNYKVSNDINMQCFAHPCHNR